MAALLCPCSAGRFHSILGLGQGRWQPLDSNGKRDGWSLNSPREKTGWSQPPFLQAAQMASRQAALQEAGCVRSPHLFGSPTASTDNSSRLAFRRHSRDVVRAHLGARSGSNLSYHALAVSPWANHTSLSPVFLSSVQWGLQLHYFQGLSWGCSMMKCAKDLASVQ